MAEFFGFEINRKKEDAAKAKSFVAPSDEDGTLDIAGGAGFFSQYVNLDKAAKNDWDLIPVSYTHLTLPTNREV